MHNNDLNELNNLYNYKILKEQAENRYSEQRSDSSGSTYQTTIIDPSTEEEVEVTIRYRYISPTPGVRSRADYGIQMTPDDPEDIEILSITSDETGEEVELSHREYNRVVDDILSNRDDSGMYSGD